MSRQATIKKLIEKGKFFGHGLLYFGEAGIPQEDGARTLFVSHHIDAAVAFPFADTPEGKRLGEFRAWLDDFVEGAELTVAEDPDRKPPDAMLARVKPLEKEFWSIRVTDEGETPGIRSFGAFSDRDEFVALTWMMREDIEIFDEEVQSAIEAWKDHFGSEGPHEGDDIHEYLTICLAV